MSMWLFAPMMNQWGWEEMLLPLAFRGLASPFAMASTVTLALGGLSPERLKSASGLFTLMRSLGGAIGIARLRHHSQRPDQSAFPAYRRASERPQTYSSTIGCTGWRPATPRPGAISVGGQAAALKKLWLLAYREAQVQAFADALPRHCAVLCALRDDGASHAQACVTRNTERCRQDQRRRAEDHVP